MSVQLKRGLGYLRDPDDHRDWSVGRLGLPSRLPAAVSHRRHVDAVLNQGSTQSCVAHAWAQALRVGDHTDGQRNPSLGSVLFLYYNARAWHDDQDTDAGTYLRTCAQGLVRFGRAPDPVWPFHLGRVNTRPSWRAYRAAFDLRGPRGYYRIANGDLASVRTAIAAGKPVVFGMAVDAAFVDDDGPLVIGEPDGPAIGGHAMCVVGYNGDNFEVVNSWGTGWRNGGFAWLTSGRLATATDLWAVDP